MNKSVIRLVFVLLTMPVLSIAQCRRNSNLEADFGMVFFDRMTGPSIGIRHTLSTQRCFDILSSFETGYGIGGSPNTGSLSIREHFQYSAIQVGCGKRLNMSENVSVRFAAQCGGMFFDEVAVQSEDNVYSHALAPVIVVSGRAQVDVRLNRAVAMGLYYCPVWTTNINGNFRIDNSGITLGVIL